MIRAGWRCRKHFFEVTRVQPSVVHGCMSNIKTSITDGVQRIWILTFKQHILNLVAFVVVSYTKLKAFFWLIICRRQLTNN